MATANSNDRTNQTLINLVNFALLVIQNQSLDLAEILYKIMAMHAHDDFLIMTSV